ncbi:AraC family ligand binding domain-containing protein [Streptomyces sp. NPDC050149]|uniref:AraC family ligand binding domain-containing protein n=1 Tax=Streptomyces sp. NPDC050149 TaxID=3365603 RepID=UPI00379139A7
MGTDTVAWRNRSIRPVSPGPSGTVPATSQDTYSFGITDAGARQFRCRGAAQTSGAGMVMAFNPEDVRDGRAAAELGHRRRIAHLGPWRRPPAAAGSLSTVPKPNDFPGHVAASGPPTNAPPPSETGQHGHLGRHGPDHRPVLAITRPLCQQPV